MTESMKRLADNVLVAALAKLLPLVGVPIILASLLGAFSMLRDISIAITKIETAVSVGIEPRLSHVEREQALHRAEMAARTADRFTKADAQLVDARTRAEYLALEARLQREIDKVTAATRKVQ